MEEEVMARLDETFAPALKEMERRQKEQTRQAQQQPPMPQAPVDYLHQQENQAYQYNQRPRLNGSTQKVSVDARLTASRLRPYYQKAKDDSERLAKVGDKEGARIAKEQYMRDVFMPTIEALVRENSPEELLNATNALAQLDNYVFTATGQGNGYTGALVASLYQSDMGNVLPTSDIDVQRTVQKLIGLVANDQIRSAVGMANKIKAKIDVGENTASQEDYELIQKIALRGQ